MESREYIPQSPILVANDIESEFSCSGCMMPCGFPVEITNKELVATCQTVGRLASIHTLLHPSSEHDDNSSSSKFETPTQERESPMYKALLRAELTAFRHKSAQLQAVLATYQYGDHDDTAAVPGLEAGVDGEVVYLRDQVRTLQLDRDEYAKQLEVKDDKIEALKAEVDGHDADTAKIVEDFNVDTEKRRQWSLKTAQDNDTLRNTIRVLESARAADADQLEMLHNVRLSLTDQLNRSSLEWLDAQGVMESLRADVSDLDRRNQKMHELIEYLEGDCTEKKQMIDQFLDDKAQLRVQRNVMFDDLNGQIIKLMEERSEQDDRIMQLEGDMQEVLSQHEDQVRKLEDRLGVKDLAIDVRDEQIHDLSTEVNALKDQKQAGKMEIDQLETKMEEMMDTHDAAVEKLEKELEAKDEELKDQQVSVHELEKQRKARNKEIQTLKEQAAVELIHMQRLLSTNDQLVRQVKEGENRQRDMFKCLGKEARKMMAEKQHLAKQKQKMMAGLKCAEKRMRDDFENEKAVLLWGVEELKDLLGYWKEGVNNSCRMVLEKNRQLEEKRLQLEAHQAVAHLMGQRCQVLKSHLKAKQEECHNLMAEKKALEYERDGLLKKSDYFEELALKSCNEVTEKGHQLGAHQLSTRMIGERAEYLLEDNKTLRELKEDLKSKVVMLCDENVQPQNGASTLRADFEIMDEVVEEEDEVIDDDEDEISEFESVDSRDGLPRGMPSQDSLVEEADAVSNPGDRVIAFDSDADFDSETESDDDSGFESG